jgi:deoxycytidine triphosphate deaminase
MLKQVKFNNDRLAEKRFKQFEACDPFPNTPPALLNSADIVDYVLATGMICPFESASLKPASYEIKLLGRCIYWDEDGTEQDLMIAEGVEFCLKPNSIAFVTLEPMFRLPDYIALRFNLKITHIYRGLLLGTGPLVDPGFKGYLSIPLHNLTSNDYKFVGGEGLIWMEFTKLSPHKSWHNQNTGSTSIRRAGKIGDYQKFPDRKLNLKNVKDYLRKAESHRSIQSSISQALLNMEASVSSAAKAASEAAESSKKSAEEAQVIQRRLTIGSIVAATALIAALLALGFQILSLVSDSISSIRELPEKNMVLQNDVNQLKKDIQRLEASISKNEKNYEEIKILKQRVEDLEKEVKNIR